MSSWKKTIIISVIFSLVLACIAVFLIYPSIRDISKSSKDLFNLKKEYLLYQDKAGKMNSFEQSQADIELIENKINGLFVDVKIPIDLMEFWEKTAKDTGVLIDISSVSLKEQAEAVWNPVGFQIIVTGSYNDFMKFLDKIENSSYLASIDNLTLKNLEEREVAAENSKKITVNDVRGILTIRVFSRNK